jgi:hypothetical protein
LLAVDRLCPLAPRPPALPPRGPAGPPRRQDRGPGFRSAETALDVIFGFLEVFGGWG